MIGALAGPTSVMAADSANVAGSPISGGYDPNIGGGNCQGTAYGRVDGAFVLFTANHCRYHLENGENVLNPEDRSGEPVYGRNGTQIGTWGPLSSAGSVHDLTFIYINASSKPSNANKVFRGPISGASDWWTMTAQPTSDFGCDGSNLLSGAAVHQNAQPVSGALTAIYRSSSTQFGYGFGPVGSGLTRNCTVKVSNTVRFNVFVESASPYVSSLGTDKLLGHATGQWSGGGCASACITFTPIYHGIEHLDSFFGGVTRLCITAAC